MFLKFLLLGIFSYSTVSTVFSQPSAFFNNRELIYNYKTNLKVEERVIVSNCLTLKDILSNANGFVTEIAFETETDTNFRL
jgi:hypothetical protein